MAYKLSLFFFRVHKAGNDPKFLNQTCFFTTKNNVLKAIELIDNIQNSCVSFS